VERNRLRAALDDGRWLSLRRLQAGFGGLDTERARLAYAASTAAALHLMERGSPDRWSRLLDALGAGASPDEALEQTFGLDTDAIDRALRARYGDTGQSAALAR
jgi:xanthine dehydrogenase molybdopterin-binding subunit B